MKGQVCRIDGWKSFFSILVGRSGRRRMRAPGSIPKGEYVEGKDPESVARREFAEETGCEPRGSMQPLTSLKEPSVKFISAWAVEGDFDPAMLKSNTFPLEWPPRSGRIQQFPEVDRGAWFDRSTACEKILPGQRPFLMELLKAFLA